MKVKKILKRNLAAVICAGMLLNPVLTAFAAEADDMSSEKNPTIILNIKDNEVDKEYKGLQFDLYAGVYDKEKEKSININCGHYDTVDKSSISVELPKDIFNTFTDENRYKIGFYIEPTNVRGDCFVDSTGDIYYKGEENESYDVILERYSYNITLGSLTLNIPGKLEYKIGEELDLTGGRTFGCGSMGSNLDDKLWGVWDDFGSPLSLQRVDAYDFDNSKPGEYVIRFSPRRSNTYDEYNVSVKPSEFTVTVVDSERPEGATAKISIVDADTGESIKGIKAALFKEDKKNKDISPYSDKLIAMWDTSDVSERLFTETDFDADKEYYIGFEEVPKDYSHSLTRYKEGYKFSDLKLFTFENENDNTEWTIELKRNEEKPKPEGTFNFRLYERYSGLREDSNNIGVAEIKDSDGNSVGYFSLDRDFELPDGEYTSTVSIFSKDYKCFSDETINFSVKNGKTETNLDYNIERSNFAYVGNGDSNNDGIVDMSDIVLIMQSLANPSKYGINGTDENHITEAGNLRADIDGNGVTNMDALTIQKYLLGYFDIK
ncbi:dockerin type I domain-containing protein [Ruminococcus flavefaciens]|uniref:dockerin type I domain-containing protein n=1 Tax=Ruminococcus flavefaciens TaxID=1265 RepID=UPI00049065B8